jgi:hypothetical protein
MVMRERRRKEEEGKKEKAAGDEGFKTRLRQARKALK